MKETVVTDKDIFFYEVWTKTDVKVFISIKMASYLNKVYYLLWSVETNHRTDKTYIIHDLFH